MKVREFCKRFINREQEIVLVNEKTNFIYETVDNLLLKDSYYGDFKIKSVHSTTCRTFNPDKEEDVLALVISKEKVKMDRKTIIYYLKAIHDSRPTAATREKKALEEAIASLEAWDKVKKQILEEKEQAFADSSNFRFGLAEAFEIIEEHLGEADGR